MFFNSTKSTSDTKKLRKKLKEFYEDMYIAGIDEVVIDLVDIDKMSDKEVIRECKKLHIK